MKKLNIIILATISVVAVLFIGYKIGDFIDNNDIKIKVNRKKDVLGTWTTEDGNETLIIKRKSVTYISKSINIKEVCKYRTSYTVLSNDELVSIKLKPLESSDYQILGAFQEIEYRDKSLFGSILISDYGYVVTEFRKTW